MARQAEGWMAVLPRVLDDIVPFWATGLYRINKKIKARSYARAFLTITGPGLSTASCSKQAIAFCHLGYVKGEIRSSQKETRLRCSAERREFLVNGEANVKTILVLFLTRTNTR